ncbi:hypothetical protein TSH7_31060 [Azospirillum sp. TSH7]|uniref:hypothetical protein n=1 Tax=unclassified Azospirillum TaxID=2630922 RepID=UPI000D610C86|nr:MULTISPECIES: hypothetical protein [unclassified Azospirillum]PWC54689.1 hypothetical protein TSH7_31060 [Azospirillum sp. TSH7]PWC61120.1 hypothetical protein TSH20_24205 [Azospirillum sp. TSH20]
MSVNTRLAAQAVTPPTAQRKSNEPEETLADRMSVGFDDLLDVVNPLQQLPVVSSVYREATGESISIPARLAGGFLFGGLPGLIGSAAMVAFEEITGDSVLGHIGSLLEDGTETAAEGAPAGTLPWMAGGGNGGDPALPSPQSLAEALRRKSGAATETDIVAPAGEQPAPQLLAKLYSLEATAKAGATRKEG